MQFYWMYIIDLGFAGGRTAKVPTCKIPEM